MLPTQAGVYVIENTQSGRIYVGSAVNLRARKHGHWGSLQRGCHKNAHLQSAWNKYGSEAFVMRPILICDRRDVVFFEQRAMDVLLKNERGYNKAPRAGNNFGIKRGVPKARPISEAHRAALSAANRGRVITADTRAKLAAANLGKRRGPHTEEARQKISSAQKGRPLSPEHVAALRRKKNIERYELDGQSLTLREWSERTGISLSSLQSRISYGWPVARALTAPVQKH